MNLLKKKDRDKKIYQAGLRDKEIELIPIHKQAMANLENKKDEEIEELEFKIKQLQIQVDNRDKEYKKIIDREIDVRQRESKVTREENNIKQFKEEVTEEISAVMVKNQEKFQRILNLIGEKSNIKVIREQQE